MADLQYQAKLELDCSEAVSVSLTDGGLWVIIDIEKDSQCILRGFLPSLGLDPNNSITTSGTLWYTQDADLQGECYIAGTVRFGYVGIYFSRNGKTIGIYKSDDDNGAEAVDKTVIVTGILGIKWSRVIRVQVFHVVLAIDSKPFLTMGPSVDGLDDPRGSDS